MKLDPEGIKNPFQENENFFRGYKVLGIYFLSKTRKPFTLNVDTLEEVFCEILFTSFDLFGTISISSEDDDVTVTPFIVTDVGAPISKTGTHGAETGDGPADETPL